MIRIFLIGLAIYFLYKLIFDLIIPVYKTTNQVRRQFNEMKDRMEDQNLNQNSQNFQNSQQKSASNPTPPKEKVGEYIDFEEIK